MQQQQEEEESRWDEKRGRERTGRSDVSGGA